MANSYIGANSVFSNGKEYIIVNNYKVEVPVHLQNKPKVVVNNNIYISGYEYKNGTWKRTLNGLIKTLCKGVVKNEK